MSTTTNTLTGNGGAGFDHVCSLNARHGLWDPSGWKVGKPCPVAICKGKLQAVGTGSKSAPTEAAA